VPSFWVNAELERGAARAGLEEALERAGAALREQEEREGGELLVRLELEAADVDEAARCVQAALASALPGGGWRVRGATTAVQGGA
jgi:hypothetical protein